MGGSWIVSTPGTNTRNWKKLLWEETVEYLVNFVYLALVFAVITFHRRFLLAAYDITYTHYWVAVIEALILAKVIMIGSMLHLGRGFEQKPLIYPTLYKTVVFTLFVAAFTLVEHAFAGLLTGKGLTGGLKEYFEKGPHEFFAGCLLLFIIFIPFFGFKELARVCGKEKIHALFFWRRVDL
jgi:hypothetical protein